MSVDATDQIGRVDGTHLPIAHGAIGPDHARFDRRGGAKSKMNRQCTATRMPTTNRDFLDPGCSVRQSDLGKAADSMLVRCGLHRLQRDPVACSRSHVLPELQRCAAVDHGQIKQTVTVQIQIPHRVRADRWPHPPRLTLRQRFRPAAASTANLGHAWHCWAFGPRCPWR